MNITNLQILSSNQNRNENGFIFVTLGKISGQEKIDIIKRGFQLQAEGDISLKKYYEGTKKYSLFQLKGYAIKYDSIPRNGLY